MVALVVTGAFMFWFIQRNSKVPAAPPPAPKTKYVAAAANLEAGQKIVAESLRLVEWPSDHPLTGAFTAAEPLIGRTVLYPLSEGQPIIERQLASAGAGSGIAVKIPDGMRAISLHTDEVVGVAGFLLPGTHVDVLVTLHPSNSPDPLTFTVLQDAEVLAAGQKTQPDPEGKPTTATEVTLLVKPEDAQRIVLASSQGTVHFVLRNGADREAFKGPPALLSQLSGIAPPAPVKEAPKPPPQLVVAKPYTVETIMGTKETKDDF
jgi:pilus assembly protein CpaB